MRKDLRVVMKEDKIALEDVVVTGYANIKKSKFHGDGHASKAGGYFESVGAERDRCLAGV